MVSVLFVSSVTRPSVSVVAKDVRVAARVSYKQVFSGKSHKVVIVVCTGVRLAVRVSCEQVFPVFPVLE